jgi:hypothetical protein
MIAVAWAVFRNSLPLQLVMLALAGWAALATNNLMQRQKGAADVTIKVKEKANDNANVATDVRSIIEAGSEAGKRGKPDPHLRPSRLQ